MAIRNVAVSGVDTKEKYIKVCELCGSKPLLYNHDDDETWEREYYNIYDDESDDEDFMNDWERQRYSHCSQYTYEEFIEKFDKKECDGKWNGHYIEASKEAYDLLIADGYIDKMYSKIIDGCKYLAINDEFAIIQYVGLGNHRDYFPNQFYVVDGKLSATQYKPDDVAFKKTQQQNPRKTSSDKKSTDFAELPEPIPKTKDELKCYTLAELENPETLEKAADEFANLKYKDHYLDCDVKDLPEYFRDTMDTPIFILKPTRFEILYKDTIIAVIENQKISLSTEEISPESLKQISELYAKAFNLTSKGLS